MAALLGAAPLARAAETGGAVQPESTRKMAARLADLAHRADPLANPFEMVPRAAKLKELLAHTSDPAEIRKLTWSYVAALLGTGDPEGALAKIDEFEHLMQGEPFAATSQYTTMVLTEKALCYLRLGEQENCLANHTTESCILPIRGGGIHRLQRGSRGAIAVLTELLRKFPGDLRARWLINIAYMTVGEYPEKVPPAWLIDPRVFDSDYDIGRYPDVAGNLGLDLDEVAGGVVLDDFDNDGFLDLMISNWSQTGQLRYFHNNGDGTFTDRTEAAGLIGEMGGLNMVQCDYNNDGFTDVLVLRGAWLGAAGHLPASLLRNNGNGSFTDVTEEAGLLRFHPTQTAVWLDFNGDGLIDLFIGNESSGADTNPCELFRNNGDGTFTECAKECGVDAVGWVKAVVTADFNHDGRPDLYLSRRDGPNILFRNDGPVDPARGARGGWKFTDVAEAAGVTEPFRSFSCWFFDYDNDGWPDLFVSGYGIQDVGDIAADSMGMPNAGERARLFRNRGDGTFEDVTVKTGLFKVLHTMGANFGDLDNDGWLDFYLGTGDPDFATIVPNRMFRNDGGQRFQDVTSSGGFGQLQKGHGIAFGDINNDGEQDIFSKVGGAATSDNFHSQLFANPGHGNRWLKLKLEGTKSNRAALGARIKVVAQTAMGERQIFRTVGSGGSFGASPLRQEIGLGPATAVTRVEIFWPVTGITQILTGIEPNHCYNVREGDATAVSVQLRTFAFPLTPDPAHPHVHHHAGSPMPSDPTVKQP